MFYIIRSLKFTQTFRYSLGNWDGAYPWLDIAGCLKHAGFDCTSVDTYNAEHGIKVPKPEPGGTHNPLFDSRAAALCYMDL